MRNYLYFVQSSILLEFFVSMIEFRSEIWPPAPGLPLVQGAAGGADLGGDQDWAHSPGGGGLYGCQPRCLGTP